MILRKVDKARLKKNHDLQGQAQAMGQSLDLKPVVKLFTPDAQATWLITELDENGIAFGLADLGMQSPELGYIDLNEIMSVRSPLGLPVERDRFFTADKMLTQYADAARSKDCVAA